MKTILVDAVDAFVIETQNGFAQSLEYPTAGEMSRFDRRGMEVKCSQMIDLSCA